MAYNARLNLIEEANSKVPGGTDTVPNLTFKTLDQQPKLAGITVPQLREPGR